MPLRETTLYPLHRHAALLSREVETPVHRTQTGRHVCATCVHERGAAKTRRSATRGTLEVREPTVPLLGEVVVRVLLDDKASTVQVVWKERKLVRLSDVPGKTSKNDHEEQAEPEVG